jgi:hypothetical protein
MALSDETKDKINTAIGVGKVSIECDPAVSFMLIFSPLEHRRLRMDSVRPLRWIHQVQPSAELDQVRRISDSMDVCLQRLTLFFSQAHQPAGLKNQVS